MSAHSPAPWRIDEDDRPGMEWNRHIYGTNGMAICFMAHSDGKSVDSDEANALLVASAPELLEALTMVRDADNDCRLDGMPTIPSAARAAIDSAIAKAGSEA